MCCDTTQRQQSANDEQATWMATSAHKQPLWAAATDMRRKIPAGVAWGGSHLGRDLSEGDGGREGPERQSVCPAGLHTAAAAAEGVLFPRLEEDEAEVLRVVPPLRRPTARTRLLALAALGRRRGCRCAQQEADRGEKPLSPHHPSKSAERTTARPSTHGSTKASRAPAPSPMRRHPRATKNKAQASSVMRAAPPSLGPATAPATTCGCFSIAGLEKAATSLKWRCSSSKDSAATPQLLKIPKACPRIRPPRQRQAGPSRPEQAGGGWAIHPARSTPDGELPRVACDGFDIM